mmetsp:Transcript_17740/g.39116  ORF Transcript_17740/g.39116 Transcript_17740/m.39116 type:complete len:200 (-) Transcript_17740:177-776(-)
MCCGTAWWGAAMPSQLSSMTSLWPYLWFGLTRMWTAGRSCFAAFRRVDISQGPPRGCRSGSARQLPCWCTLLLTVRGGRKRAVKGSPPQTGPCTCPSALIAPPRPPSSSPPTETPSAPRPNIRICWSKHCERTGHLFPMSLGTTGSMGLELLIGGSDRADSGCRLCGGRWREWTRWKSWSDRPSSTEASSPRRQAPVSP